MQTAQEVPSRQHFYWGFRAFARVALLLVVLMSVAACQMGGTSSAAESPTASAAPVSAAPTAVPTAVAPMSATSTVSISAMDFSTAIRDVAQQVRPAVVQITNEQVQLDQFNQSLTVPAGVGSGVIYDTQGHILTNNHVIDGAEQLLVSLPDGRSFPAKLVGADPQTDLAVVQITGSNLPVATFGDSAALQAGDWVVAIGNALALPGGPTVSAGVVGALGRTVQEPGASANSAGPYLIDVIQTDAPINPGNSGGPLINLQGQVVGINTLVAGQAEPGIQAQGIGFTISINAAKPIADQLVATGQAVHPYLGVAVVPLNPVITSRLGINAKNGVLIVTVQPGSPAAVAGLQARDVVTQIDSAGVADDSAFAEILNSHKPGDTITLTVLRSKQTLQLKASLAQHPSS